MLSQQEGFLKTVTGLGLGYLKEPEPEQTVFVDAHILGLVSKCFGSILGFSSTVLGLSVTLSLW